MTKKFHKILEEGPVLIVVSGAPGSGKTTLAKALGSYLRMLHFERDTALHNFGLAHKGDSDYDRSIGVPKYLKLVEGLLDSGISVVTDGTLYKNLSETDYKKLLSRDRVANIHCRSNNENQRLIDRETARYGEAPDWLGELVEKLDRIYVDVVDPLDLGCPQLVVDTNADYSPSLAEIEEFLLANL